MRGSLQTTVEKMIEVTKPVLSYLKFQLSDRMSSIFTTVKTEEFLQNDISEC